MRAVFHLPVLFPGKEGGGTFLYKVMADERSVLQEPSSIGPEAFYFGTADNCTVALPAEDVRELRQDGFIDNEFREGFIVPDVMKREVNKIQ